jgi:exonuclease SbcD
MKDGFIVVGDVHEGINFGYRIDPRTGVSDRAMDIHRNFVAAANYAIEHRSRLFIVLGDMFDRTHVSPVFREMIRKDVIEPLREAGAEVWILAGNHDQPRSMPRSTSLDDFKAFSNVKVFRTPEVETREIDGKKVGFIIAPFLHPEQFVEKLREKDYDIGQDDAFPAAQRLWGQWIKDSTDEIESDFTVLLGHYHVEGSQLSAFNRNQYLPTEFSFSREMIPENVDLALFGHIHLHQNVTDRIVYVGSVERIDWGEREEEKGFISVDTDRKKWEFVKLDTRAMIKVELDLSSSENPTKDILEGLPGDIDGALLRLFLKGPEGLRNKIDEKKVEDALSTTFFHEVRWEEFREEKAGYSEFTVDPHELFQRFVSQNYSKHPDKEKLLEFGSDVLKEVLE